MHVLTMTGNVHETNGCSSEFRSTQKGPLVGPQRRVRFGSHIDVQEVPRRSDISTDDLDAAWYNQKEFENIKKTLVVTLRLMVSNKPIGEDQCTRGLEVRAPAGAKLRKKKKLDALTAVWNEQVSQWKEDKTDEEAISFVYQQQVHESREVARRMGLLDEKVARHIQDSNLDESASNLSKISFDVSANQALEEPQMAAILPSAA